MTRLHLSYILENSRVPASKALYRTLLHYFKKREPVNIIYDRDYPISFRTYQEAIQRLANMYGKVSVRENLTWSLGNVGLSREQEQYRYASVMIVREYFKFIK